MNETLKAAGHIGAELGAAKAEIERLRQALRAIVAKDTYTADYSPKGEPIGTIIGPRGEIAKAALSQQAEPVEPAPAQDEREAFEAWFLSKWPANQLYRRDALPAGDPRYDEYCNPHVRHAYEGWLGRATRPAQVEQKPSGWKLVPVELTQEMNDAGRKLLAQGSVPMSKVFRAILDAAPIAQTAPQPEQSGLVEAAREAVEYLDANHLNQISSRSRLHLSLRAALSATPSPAMDAKEE